MKKGKNDQAKKKYTFSQNQIEFNLDEKNPVLKINDQKVVVEKNKKGIWKSLLVYGEFHSLPALAETIVLTQSALSNPQIKILR